MPATACVGHVGAVHDGGAAGGLHLLQGLLRAGFVVGVVDAHLGAGRGQLQRNLTADIAAATGDDRHLVLELIHLVLQ
jgi:hypothetical protein